MTTIKDIAKKANVSTGTVDRVIHNRPGVSKKTKAHIEKIIKEHNFQINTIASTLALNKTYKIAVLIPEASTENEFWSAPKKGIDAATEDVKNFRVSTTFFMYSQFESASYTNAFNTIITNNFDAVLIAPVFQKETIEIVAKLEQKNIPYIFINTQIEGLKPLSFIGQDSFKSGYLGAKLMKLILPENSNILIPVFRLNKGNHTSINQRINGFKTYFEEKNSPVNITEVEIPSFTDFESITKQLNLAFNNTTLHGVFVPSSNTFLISKYLEARSLKNVRVIGFDTNNKNLTYLKNDTIDFLISQNPFSQGYEGIKLLSDYLVMNKTPNTHYYTPLTIVTKENID